MIKISPLLPILSMILPFRSLEQSTDIITDPFYFPQTFLLNDPVDGSIHPSRDFYTIIYVPVRSLVAKQGGKRLVAKIFFLNETRSFWTNDESRRRIKSPSRRLTPEI